MNPAIHHPQWYRAVDLISESELSQVISVAGAVVIVPQLSHFKLGAIEVQCLQNRWIVKTTERGEIDRIFEVAAAVFRRLGDTPVRAFGVNFECLHDSAKDLRATLRIGLKETPLGLTFDGLAPDLDSATLSYGLAPMNVEGQPLVHRILKATIATVPGKPGTLKVSLNGDHRIDTEGKYERFDLDVLLDASRAELKLGEALVHQLLERVAEHKG